MLLGLTEAAACQGPLQCPVNCSTRLSRYTHPASSALSAGQPSPLSTHHLIGWGHWWLQVEHLQVCLRQLQGLQFHRGGVQDLIVSEKRKRLPNRDLGLPSPWAGQASKTPWLKEEQGKLPGLVDSPSSA